MPDEDNNFGGSFVLDFRKWWRHVQSKNRELATFKVEGEEYKWIHEKDHAMDCIVHGGHVARTINDEIPPPVPGTASEEDFLDETTNQKIRTLTMKDSESDNNR